MPKVLSIVIPAYNEERSIVQTLQDVLEAKTKIMDETDIDDVELIVVNDGSEDKTGRYVNDFLSDDEIKLISFEKNRGYGAAIKEGFRLARGEYLGFFDADNTCDPRFFVDLYNILQEKKADIAVGSRTHGDSKMPTVRRIGNVLFAKLVNTLWRTHITDSASGMRILRRDALKEIYPLPDGLHFTPSMTCKALSNTDIRIVESPMPYEERKGKSKLNILKDGYRFLITILEFGFSYRPFVFFGSIGMIFYFLALAYGVPVIVHYLRYQYIAENMIYRILAVITGIIVGSTLMFINLIMRDFIAYANNQDMMSEKTKTKLARVLLRPKMIVLIGLGLLFMSIALNLGALLEYITTKSISQHWIYTMVGAYLFIQGTIVFVFGVAEHIILVHKRNRYSDL
ncbi:MAG: glycosyltransferase family 2 protein [Desulfatiglans sp.]|jgi:glycosyltransferase involved in cell wall biosynthesis|nr:glycosyltransferase family 2 protein [Thermodesulfobacteriota bacterium]MEE4351280.1 glycosyltransferase family 2 protein [Desulfatiglans sp.]